MNSQLFFACFLSFLSGSIPFGKIFSMMKGIDIQKVGSGNIGATNVSRALGWKIGVLVLFLDALKGGVPVFLVLKFYPFLAPDAGWVAFSAILGHCFSPFLKGKGGKGVATGLGAFSILSPYSVLMAAGIFLIIVTTTRFVALGSLLASLSFGVFLGLFFEARANLLLPVFSAIALIWFLHSSNIRRLFHHEEPKFTLSMRPS